MKFYAALGDASMAIVLRARCIEFTVPIGRPVDMNGGLASTNSVECETHLGHQASLFVAMHATAPLQAPTPGPHADKHGT